MRKSTDKKVIVVLGTTASGKTRLAVSLARQFNGEIISADSRQVYKGMDIGTGKDLKEYGKTPYYLIDIVSPKKQFTVSEFQKRAYEIINDILKRGKVPILCGGTGLYIDAVVDGYELGREEGRKGGREIRKRLEKKTLPQLLALLKRVDAKTYIIIDKKNARRVQRALEIYYETGVPKSRQVKKKNPPYNFLKIGVTFPKEQLEKRISKRFDKRLEEGMVREVSCVKKQGLSWKRLEEFGLEYKWISFYLQKKMTREEMREKLKTEIVRFAKRQMTWFKRDKKIIWVKNLKEARIAVKEFL